MTKRSIAMCSHCGAAPATTLKINKENPDLDGYDVGCPETQELLEENDIGNNPNFYVIEDYCSPSCIYLAGEMAHAVAED